MKEITSDRSWIRASSFIEEKFGKKIGFKFLTISSDEEQQASHKCFAEGDDLIVPLQYKNQKLGRVVVYRGALLSTEQQMEASDIIQFLVEPQIYNKVLSLNMSSLSDLKNDSKNNGANIIQLFNTENRDDVVSDSTERDSRKLVSQFIHIKSKLPMTRHKVAMKIHEMVGTIVLLRLQDIYDGTEEVNMNMDLSDTALFVEDIMSLNSNQLDFLQKLVRSNKAKNSVILVGSDLDENQIHQMSCSTDFKHDLLGLSYDADRVPYAQQASEEVLELLFFSETPGLIL